MDRRDEGVRVHDNERRRPRDGDGVNEWRRPRDGGGVDERRRLRDGDGVNERCRPRCGDGVNERSMRGERGAEPATPCRERERECLGRPL